MKRCWAIVEDVGWSIVRVGDAVGGDLTSAIGDSTLGIEGGVEPGMEEWAKGVRRVLDEQGYAGEEVLLGLASQRCMIGRVGFEVDGRDLSLAIGDGGEGRGQKVEGRVRRDEGAVLYQLEEQWPVALEELTVGLVHSPSGVLGVAVETAPVLRVVEALEKYHIQVRTIVPWSMLALQGAPPDRKTDVVVVRRAIGQAVPPHPGPLPHSEAISQCNTRGGGEGESGESSSAACLYCDEVAEVFEFTEGRLSGWCWLEPGEVERHLRLIGVERGRELVVERRGLVESHHDRPNEVPLTPAISPAGESNSISVSSAGERERLGADRVIGDGTLRALRRVMSGTETPWVELRRGALAAKNPWRAMQGAIHTFVAALLLFLLTIAGALQWWGWENDRLAGRYQSQQAELFRQVLPNQAVPSGILSRLKSELNRLEGESGESSALPKRASAAVSLLRLLTGLPQELRYQVHEIGVDGGQISLQGAVLSLGDAGTIAESLKTSGFEVSAPTTTQAAEGFNWVLTGSLTEESRDE